MNGVELHPIEEAPMYDESTIEGRRARRRAALNNIQGLWKGREDLPGDGVEQQRRMRDEWDTR